MTPKNVIRIAAERAESWLPNGIRRMLPDDFQYDVTISRGGDVIVDIKDGGGNVRYKQAGLVDQDFFPHDMISGPELEVLAKADKYTQAILLPKGHRVYSGLAAHSHIIRGLKTLVENARAADVILDFETMLGYDIHDNLEDRSDVRNMLGFWEKALFNLDTTKMREYSAGLMKLRNSGREEMRDLFKSFIPGSVQGSERENLEKKIDRAVTLGHNVTRFTDLYPYGRSISIELSVMGDETLDMTLRRPLIKLPDKTGNLEEHGPLDYRIMAQLDRAFKDGRTTVDSKKLGEWLKEQYGTINPDGRDMPTAMQVQLAFNSLFLFHFFNQTLNKYAAKLPSYGQEVLQFSKLGMASRDKAIDAALGLLRNAILKYEEDRDINLYKPQVDDEIRDLQQLGSSFHDRFTIGTGSVIEPLMVYDVGGRKFIESLDNAVITKREMYRAGRHLELVLGKFKMYLDPNDTSANGRPALMNNNGYDPKRHQYFTLRDLDKALELLPDYPEIVRKLRASVDTKYHTGLFGGFRTFSL